MGYREVSLSSWEAAAAGWARWSERLGAMSRPVTDWIVDRLDAQPGWTVLELAAGTGDTGYEIAQRLGPDGRLITSDFSATMLEFARRRAEELGVAAEFHVIDAERIELPDGIADGVVCRYAYMLMSDPGVALRETRRVLRPGGRLVFTTWGPPEQNPWASVAGRVLVERGVMPPPEPGQPGLFALADHDRIRSLLAAAGFGSVVIDDVPLALAFEDFDDYWDFMTTAAGAVSGFLAALPDETRSEIRDETAKRLERFADADGRLSFAALSVNVAAS